MSIDALDYFAALVKQDDSIPLFEAALTIAFDAEPKPDLAATQAELDILAARLSQRLPRDASAIQKLRMLNHFFYQELGFAGNVNDYYTPDNSYLDRVLASRRGIPISLAVIYMELAQQIGLDVRGISFPGHFLMKLSVTDGDIILDPFNGTSLSRSELEDRLEGTLPMPMTMTMPDLEQSLAAYLQPAQPREILVRMLRNLKALFLQQQDWQRLLGVQQRLLILLPKQPSERRDRGLAFAHLACPLAALQDFEAYLDHHPFAADADDVRARLPALRAAIQRLN